ncbi:MAG: hypothetical protein M1828_003941 [Chrysothrix sp. TS-e1954]|nr:MAG: hypothetical protein M1828_003941 [Chrysothrix sp. TS-e1954]
MRSKRSEASSNPESPVARSNDSGDGSQKTSSVRKDRPCPFCRQPFTSSSLGRHLDLYIKDRNPKAPDGVHDVDQIRKLRGKITRRHARTSSSAPNGMVRPNESPSASVSTLKPQPLEPQPLTSDSLPPRSSFSLDPSANGRAAIALNKLNWQATGVINDLPPRAAPLDPNEVRLRQYTAQDWSRTRDSTAAEAALKDVLSTVRSACARVQTSQLFDFDTFALNFPALCFKLLTPPTTFFSSTPSTAPGAWPLGPPRESEYQSLQECIKIETQKNVRAAEERAAAGGFNGPFINAPAKFIEALARRAVEHVDKSFMHWNGLSGQEQQDLWQMELMRAFANEKDELRESKETLEKTRQEVDQLRTQLDAVRDPQRSAQQHIGPGQIPQLSSRTANELAQGGSDPDAWDYDTIINRYRAAAEYSVPYTASPSQQRQGPPNHGQYQSDSSRRQSYATVPMTHTASRQTRGGQPHMGPSGRVETDTEMDDRDTDHEYHIRRNLGAG